MNKTSISLLSAVALVCILYLSTHTPEAYKVQDVALQVRNAALGPAQAKAQSLGYDCEVIVLVKKHHSNRVLAVK